MENNNIERGAASIIIELLDGNITVFYGEDNIVLHEIKNAKEGSWSKIWEAIRAIQPIQ